MNNPVTHHGMVSEYQGSGVPYVSSSLVSDTSVGVFNFPYVSRHFTVFNSGSGDVRVGFTQNGVNAAVDSNYFLVLANSQSPRLEVKCLQVFFRKNAGTAANNVSIVAGLTNVSQNQMFAVTGSNGVAGVG